MSSNTLPKHNSFFNMLYLDYNEHLFNSTSAYIHNQSKVTKASIYITSHSIIIVPPFLTAPLTKLSFSKNFHLTIHTTKDLSLFYKETKLLYSHPDKLTTRQTYFQMSSNKALKFSHSNLIKKKFHNINHNNLTQTFSSSKKLINKNYTMSNSTINANNNTLNEKDKKRVCIIKKSLKQLLLQAFTNNDNNENTNINLNDSEFVNSIFNIYLKDLCNYCDNSIFKIGKILKLFHGLFTKKIINSDNNEMSKAYCVLTIKCENKTLIDRSAFKFTTFDKSNFPNKKFNVYLIIIEDYQQNIDIFLKYLTTFTDAFRSNKNNSIENAINNVINDKIIFLQNKYYYKKEEDNNNEEDKGGGTLNEINMNSKINVTFYANAKCILPEKHQNGIFIIHLYNQTYKDYLCEFIPVNNTITSKYTYFYLNNIRLFLSFRYLYRYKAIHLFLNYPSTNSFVFDFDNQEDFTYIYNFFSKNCKKSNSHYYNLKYHTNLWVDGLLTNYDYLMYLNTLASRSFNDLSQYPIFPWTINNFKDKSIDLNNIKNYRDLSKPIGAVNISKMQKRKEKFNEVNYHYRNYISYPYIVFYYLMRSHPLFYLRYQNGSFGPADRMFISLQNTWNVTYNNIGLDIKELIPEFYDTEVNGFFLKNIHSLHLGTTQEGITVDDVILPPWASSCSNFIMIMRNALESEIVSNNLHQWIDLVFGYKQKGNKSIEEQNVYYQLRYENSIFDIDEKNTSQRQSDIDDIIECGQTPIQLFGFAHPRKRSHLILSEIHDLKVCSNKKEVEIYKQKQERILIEKKYEKERRIKENQTEKIKKIFEDKYDTYNQTIKSYESEYNKKENSFKHKVEELNKDKKEQNENFEKLKTIKENTFKEQVKKIQNENDIQIKTFFNGNDELFKHMKTLEKIVQKYETREKEFIAIENALNTKYEEIINQNKELHKLQNKKGNILRKVPLHIRQQVK